MRLLAPFTSTNLNGKDKSIVLHLYDSKNKTTEEYKFIIRHGLPIYVPIKEVDSDANLIGFESVNDNLATPLPKNYKCS